MKYPLRIVSITIPAPKASPGDQIQVLNYRMRPAQWEAGEVASAEYRLPNQEGNGGGWTYQVLLERKSPRGTYMHLHVGDDAIA